SARRLAALHWFANMNHHERVLVNAFLCMPWRCTCVDLLPAPCQIGNLEQSPNLGCVALQSYHGLPCN
ncbi:MAG: hypothetical protein P4L87_26005, partial [Formivibrio sp.]|nr:hypothetical protein [Formivibrio sp.]